MYCCINLTSILFSKQPSGYGEIPNTSVTQHTPDTYVTLNLPNINFFFGVDQVTYAQEMVSSISFYEMPGGFFLIQYHTN